jgi:hypothetical protein
MTESTEERREYTCDEAIARYYGEWILMKVTGFDEYYEPARGYVITHSPHRRDTSAALAKEPRRSELPPETPPQPYYTFKAFPRVHVGETYEEAAARFAEQRAAAMAMQGG